ncbi:MAG: hypothetical protein K2O01_03580, partial [Bacteroidales bacterium]|nr:hypothetical protein [Bacteroidales bacterium]
VFNAVPADADGDGIPDWTALDTLKMTLPTVRDTMEIQVVVKNRCAEARMPGLTIQTDDAIGLSDVYTVVQVSDHICDEEKLTYKVVSVTGTDTADGVAKAGQYVWYTPWHDVPDTTDIFRLTFDTTAYKPGKVYVVPNNGCGDGHRSDSIEIQAADILQPPLRAQPVPSLDFAAGYDPAAGVVLETLSDSVCLRAPFDMAVRAELSPAGTAGAPRDSLRYGWFTVCGEAGALKTVASDSSAVELTVPDFADSAYIIYVAARRSVCQRFGDSLRIDIFPMDTIRFIDDPVEDSLPYDRFTVLTRGAIQDRRPTPPVDTMSATPCVGSAHVYAIKPDFHWSLKPGSAPSFSWNGGRTGVKTGDILDGTLGWVCDNPSQLPAVLSVGAVGVAGDLLNLSVHAENICGPSVSKPVAVRPQALIDVAEQPVFKPLAPICET